MVWCSTFCVLLYKVFDNVFIYSIVIMHLVHVVYLVYGLRIFAGCGVWCICVIFQSIFLSVLFNGLIYECVRKSVVNEQEVVWHDALPLPCAGILQLELHSY